MIINNYVSVDFNCELNISIFMTIIFHIFYYSVIYRCKKAVSQSLL